jgi:hypothetical protein
MFPGGEQTRKWHWRRAHGTSDLLDIGRQPRPLQALLVEFHISRSVVMLSNYPDAKFLC